MYIAASRKASYGQTSLIPKFGVNKLLEIQIILPLYRHYPVEVVHHGGTLVCRQIGHIAHKID